MTKTIKRLAFVLTLCSSMTATAQQPLNRGLMAVSLNGAGMGTGNLVSWRIRQTDDITTKFKLYSGTSANSQTKTLNDGKFILDRTNFRDAEGTANTYYKVEAYDKYGNLIDAQSGVKAWANQTLSIPLGTGPTDPDHGATYTPNDASFCDMDGDGEYEIILKWSPSNEKDAASSGTTSSPYFDCVKMDGTRLWRIRLGDNFFTSAHTIQFIAWDLDGDGYGEFMCKTAPGTIDGLGNYVLLGNDSPTENLLSGRGKQDHGSEYITVFNGRTGANMATIPYHTKYSDESTSFWGDDKQNRSERYLAALAYLDGPEKNPSAIFARGYYSGAKVGAYDWNGEELTLRWLHRSATSGKDLWGEGAHWISVGDVDGDGKQEITYGSACLNTNGTVRYRTGLGHGDALHLGDLLPDRPGLELLMCHEHKPYGIDIRDASTGEILQRQTESDDTGRGLAAHFDSSRRDWQFLTSARAQMFNCSDQSVNAESWSIGSSGAGVNCRVYWDGDLYDEFFDKSIIAHWNPTNKWFDRIKFNNTNYVAGNLNNDSKHNPCVLGDLLGDWREEIVTWNGDNTAGFNLLVNATHAESNYRLPHLMDDPQYRAQVVNQNCCYNQPPHLSYDPAISMPNGYVDMTVITEGMSVEPGTYYLQNMASGKFLTAGNSWGTRAILGNVALDFTLAFANGIYTIDSRIANATNKHFLNDDTAPYVDGLATQWTISDNEDGTFCLTSSAGKRLCADEADNETLCTTIAPDNARAKWRLLSRAEMIEQMAEGTPSSPQDATWMLQDPDFGRNNTRFNQWQGYSPQKGGKVENMCAEVFHKAFNMYQTMTAIPNGIYELRCQGFVRADEGNTNEHAYLYATASGLTHTKTLTFLDDGGILSPKADNMEEASMEFSAGEYSGHTLQVEVFDGKLTVGIQTANTEDWTIFDNFQLRYLGKNVVDVTDNFDSTRRYYMELAANDGGATGLFANLSTEGAYNTHLSATPFAVKLEQIGSNYAITNPQNGNWIAAENGYNSNWGTYPRTANIYGKSNEFAIEPQPDATILLANQNGTFKGWGWHLGALDIAEGAEISCYKYRVYPVSSKWILHVVPTPQGDVDQDYDIDIDDIVLLHRIMLGLEPYRSSADVDGNGTVTVSDLTRLIQLLK